MITPNQHDELTLFLGCEELSRKTFLVDMSDFDINSILHGYHLYCVNDCHTNTYIQNVVKDEALGNIPSFYQIFRIKKKLFALIEKSQGFKNFSRLIKYFSLNKVFLNLKSNYFTSKVSNL
jgi:hypothetical protein